MSIPTTQLQSIDMHLQHQLLQLLDELWKIFLTRLSQIAYPDEIEELDFDVLQSSYTATLSRRFMCQMHVIYEQDNLDEAEYRDFADTLLVYYRTAETQFLRGCHSLSDMVNHLNPDSRITQLKKSLAQLHQLFLEVMSAHMIAEDSSMPSSEALTNALQQYEDAISEHYLSLSPHSQQVCQDEYCQALAEIRLLLGYTDVELLPQTEWKLQLLTGTAREKND